MIRAGRSLLASAVLLPALVGCSLLVDGSPALVGVELHAPTEESGGRVVVSAHDPESGIASVLVTDESGALVGLPYTRPPAPKRRYRADSEPAGHRPEPVTWRAAWDGRPLVVEVRNGYGLLTVQEARP